MFVVLVTVQYYIQGALIVSGFFSIFNDNEMQYFSVDKLYNKST
jgi:hypothetical protein